MNLLSVNKSLVSRFSILFLLGSASSSFAVLPPAQEPDWSEGTKILHPRSNPYEISETDFETTRTRGLLHTLHYPVEISGVVIPYRPVTDFIERPSENPIRIFLQRLFSGLSHIRSMDDFFSRVGLHRYPEISDANPYEIPRLPHQRPELRMGATLLERNGIEVLTISCAACHSSNLFGKKILGLTNRFPKANEFFHYGKKIARAIPTNVFSEVMGANPKEDQIYRELRRRLPAIGTKLPVVNGLDTSLAQVSLSLARRGQDPYAQFDPRFERQPRPEPLSSFVADSKPAVWWNLKYKNRWLSDGSVVSGNPIFTNLLWNEIGRGTDLKQLEQWLEMNPSIVRELTTAVFSTEAPKITDFFPAERISLERAQRGENHFKLACAGCHGLYEKAWSRPDADGLSLAERIRTDRVLYKEQTKVVDVGTDPNRYQGMESLARGLNPLSISQKNGILIRPQRGYVPPPLVGIWSRFPYFHNNSIPNLCALFSPEKTRPTTFWMGEALDRDRDFDFDCVGYPTGDRAPTEWKQDREFLYDTSRAGMSNRGHYEKIFIKDGKERFSSEEKLDLLEFLKTL